MAAPYIPPRDVDLDAWSQNFANLITATPATYGLDPTAAAAIQTLVDAYHAAYLIGGSAGRVPVNPSTRTPVTVGDKNTQKQAMLPVVRAYASQIRLNPGVADSDKLALGLNLPNNAPAPKPAPSTAPVLTIVNTLALRHVLKFRDETASPTSRAKAPQCIGLELHVTIAVAAATDPDASPYFGTFTKVPFNVDFTAPDAGKVATYWGRWINRAGAVGNNQALIGPWSTGISQVVPSAG